jgi:hypothetical protein
MQTTYHAVKAIEDHLFDSARRRSPKRRARVEKTAKAEEKVWATLASRPAVSPS